MAEGKRKRRSPPPREYAATKYKNPGELGLSALFNTYKSTAKQHDRVFELTLEEFKELTSAVCSYCGCEPSLVSRSSGNTCQARKDFSSYKYNGVHRLNSDFGYVQGNVVTCCKRCNIAKNDQTEEQFLDQVKRIYERRWI
jgi:hypothetical protein